MSCKQPRAPLSGSGIGWVQPRGCCCVPRRAILKASSAGVRALGLPSACTQADCAATWDERENGDAFFSWQALQSDGLACSLGGRALASRHPCQLRPHPLDLLCTHASSGAPHPHLLLATLSSFINFTTSGLGVLIDLRYFDCIVPALLGLLWRVSGLLSFACLPCFRCALLPRCSQMCGAAPGGYS